jgi:uncharacterized RDD family membrane protein YckC
MFFLTSKQKTKINNCQIGNFTLVNKVELNTPFNITLAFTLAEFHKRLFAWAIDLFVMLCYFWAVSTLLTYLMGQFWDDSHPYLSKLIYIPFVLYHLVSEILMKGQSFGKKIMGLRIINLDGSAPSISQYLIRWIFRLIDMNWFAFAFAAIYYNEYWMIIVAAMPFVVFFWSPYQQRIGDLLASTTIVYTKIKNQIEDTIFININQNYKPKYPQVMQLSDKDISTIKKILKLCQKDRKTDLAQRVAEKIRDKFNLSYSEHPYDFLSTLLKDYNYFVKQ